MVAVPTAAGKLWRLIEAGMWSLHPKGYFDTGRYLTIKPPSIPTPYPPARIEPFDQVRSPSESHTSAIRVIIRSLSECHLSAVCSPLSRTRSARSAWPLAGHPTPRTTDGGILRARRPRRASRARERRGSTRTRMGTRA